MKILAMYKKGSGQKVNVSKFGIFFNKNTSDEDRNKGKDILGFIE